jgi:hypothetical protein
LDHGFSRPILITPLRECTANDSHPIIQITSPSEGQLITSNSIDLVGEIDASSNFDYYTISFESASNPGNWVTLVDHSHTPVKDNNKIFTWDLADVPGGQLTLRIYLHSTQGGYFEKRFHIYVQLPTPTPTMTPTMTPTPITPTPTSTNIPSSTPTPSATATPTGTITGIPPSP